MEVPSLRSLNQLKGSEKALAGKGLLSGGPRSECRWRAAAETPAVGESGGGWLQLGQWCWLKRPQTWVMVRVSS